MKKLLFLSLISSSIAGLAIANEPGNHSHHYHPDESGATLGLRLNGLYVDEVFGNDGDEGEGGTAELAFVLKANEDFYQSIGIEVGYIESDTEGLFEDDLFEADSELIPLFANFTFGGNLPETLISWEIGAGAGVLYADINGGIDENDNEAIDEDEGNDDDELVVAGQVFGRLGLEIVEGFSLHGGVRYMYSDEGDFFGIEERPLDSVAYEVSGTLAF